MFQKDGLKGKTDLFVSCKQVLRWINCCVEYKTSLGTNSCCVKNFAVGLSGREVKKGGQVAR